MIVRIWHGWTTPATADRHERRLREEVFASIGARRIDGYPGIDLLRRPAGEEVEFATLMRFTALDAVRRFAGEDYETAVVPEAARRLLSKGDARSAPDEAVITTGG